MTLRAAFQMDPMDSLNIGGDSSFALMLRAQERGISLWHYHVGALTWDGARLYAHAHPVTVQHVPGKHYQFGDPVTLDLGQDVDVVFMRQDPPFDLSYITATHLLERICHETLVLNDPASVRNAPEKLFVLDYAHFMPPTMITRSLDEARAFLAVAVHVDADRLRTLDVGVDVVGVTDAAQALQRTCDGEGPAGQTTLGQRFRWLTAPRSTVVQTGPTHSGLTADPVAELDRLLTALVR